MADQDIQCSAKSYEKQCPQRSRTRAIGFTPDSSREKDRAACNGEDYENSEKYSLHLASVQTWAEEDPSSDRKFRLKLYHPLVSGPAVGVPGTCLAEAASSRSLKVTSRSARNLGRGFVQRLP